MSKKSHLKIKNADQIESTTSFKYNYGFADSEERDAGKRVSTFNLANYFRPFVRSYERDLESKYESRDRELKIPYSIDYITINFHNQFNILKYNQLYFNELGLESIEFTNFNTTGLFAVIDEEKFNNFFKDLEQLVGVRARLGILLQSRPRFIGYMKSFYLLTTKDILTYNIENDNDILILTLINIPADEAKKQTLVEALENYLSDHLIEYIYDEQTDRIEISAATDEQVLKVVQNFDIILSVTSSFYKTIGPSEFNTVQLNQSFVIVNADEELPIIAILDTGISVETPLKDILIDDQTFTLGGSPFEDNCGWGRNGHGTAVGALAALGKNNHVKEFDDEVLADAKILSIKILDNDCGSISEKKLLETLYAVKEKYPEIKIFVLTSCYENPKKTNEKYSEYTSALDKFAFDTDSLIFICTANNDGYRGLLTQYDHSYFGNEISNLCTPADSMNNIVVGAASDNLFDTCPESISPGKEFPAIYSSTGHIDQKVFLSPMKVNKNLFRPDIIESGGDLGFNRLNEIDETDPPALKLLSAKPEIGSYYAIGTSFSTPLVANIAAKIQREYPDIKTQTLKALLINAASLKNISFPDSQKHLVSSSCGNGIAENDASVFSNENAATFILEDSIKQEQIKIYPVNIPRYIVQEKMGKNQGVLKITATLCFSFLPIQNNQLSYCPIHIAYSFFKNHNSQEIQQTNDAKASFFKSSLKWSQNGRFVARPIPYSNSQKMTFLINCDELEREKHTLKLAIHCKLSKQIVGGLPEGYAREFPFSLVFKIEETLKENTGLLYDELIAINKVEILNDIALQGDLQAE